LINQGGDEVRVHAHQRGELGGQRMERAVGRDIADIVNRADIAGLVEEFYRRAFADELLGPIFIDIARVDLAAHLPVMCDFWESALLHTGRYHGNALRPHQRLHAQVALTPTHFQRWLALWSATIDQRHRGERAELAKQTATRIAGALSRRLLGCPAGEVHGPAANLDYCTDNGETSRHPYQGSQPR
jgi:hemoglobin